MFYCCRFQVLCLHALKNWQLKAHSTTQSLVAHSKDEAFHKSASYNNNKKHFSVLLQEMVITKNKDGSSKPCYLIHDMIQFEVCFLTTPLVSTVCDWLVTCRAALRWHCVITMYAWTLSVRRWWNQETKW